MIVATLNRTAKALATAVIGAEYVLRWLPRGTHEYAKFITPSELATFGRKVALEIQATRGLEHNPITKRYKLSDDTRVNYMLATQKSE
mgnify:CR=1 FL=1